MVKKVSVDLPNARSRNGAPILSLALEQDETTIKVSIPGDPGGETFVRAAYLIEAVRLFEAAVGAR